MDTQIIGAILTAGLSIIAGVAGYFYREYRNRVEPFVAIKSIRGDIKKLSQNIEIPNPIVTSLKKTITLNKLYENDSVGEVYETAKTINRFKSDESDPIEKLKLILSMTKENKIEESLDLLSKILLVSSYSNFIFYVIATSKITVPKVNPDLQIMNHIYPSNEFNGSLCISFLNSTAVVFGENFNKHEMIREKCMNFAHLIERADIIGLNSVFSQIKDLYENDMNISKEIYPLIYDILQNNSRWEFQIFIANLGKTPFLIHLKADLIVKDINGAIFKEKCYALRLWIDEENKTTREDTDSPLILCSEKDLTFAFITEKTQGEMQHGKAFREAFESGKAKFYIEFIVEKNGINRIKRVKTYPMLFKQTSSSI